MKRIAWTLALLSLAGCGSLPSPATAVPAGGVVPVLATDAQALRHAEKQLDALSAAISFRLPGADTYGRARNLANHLLKGGVAVAFNIRTRGEEVTLLPCYADGEIMLRAYRNPSLRSKLTAAQSRALGVAEAAVRDVRARYRSDYDRALALHDFLVQRSEYADSHAVHDTANATANLLNGGRGVCDSYTRAYRLMLTIDGIDNKFVAGTVNGVNHCWNLVRLEGKWVHVDCTYSDPRPDDRGRIYHTHFALPDTLLARDHRWNRSLYPAATSPELYYPMRHRSFGTVRELAEWGLRQPAADNNYITAYVEELRTGGGRNAAEHLIRKAHAELGTQVFASYAVEKVLPGVICVKLHR